MRRFLVAVSTAAAFCLMAGGGPAAAATQNGGARQTVTSTDLPDTVSPNGGRGHAAPHLDGSCTQVSAAVRATLRTAATQCVTVRTPQATQDDAKVNTLATELAAEDPEDYDPGADDPLPGDPPSEACSIIKGEYQWTRTGGLCGSAEVEYNLYDGNGKLVGTGLMDVSTTLHTQWDSTDLTEDINVAVTKVTGEVTALNIKFRTDCTNSCLATQRTPWYGNTALGEGQSKSGTVSYSGAVPAGQTRTSFQTQYQMYVTTAGATPVDPSASWSPPADAVIRCDTEMPTTSGCVIPFAADEDAPILEYSLSNPNHGQASAAYELGLRMRGSNLFHGENEDVGNQNRSKTCGNFTNLYPDIPGADSCDEFPFARTMEGGTDGALCAEITPTEVNGQWTTPPTDPNKPVTNQPCIRSHMTLFANKSAGSIFANFKKYNRIIRGDSFWMAIVP
ncbi:hypothetical protein [Streptomyces sp. NPDC001315]|uniref:NucA/NucB deoxyribonuclease domain-containing protein n=1 Tax=Streptomyces sp. NPDC001315 TaxID=3364562 RepID=UPI0036D0BB86